MAGVITLTTADANYVQLVGARAGRRRVIVQNITAGATSVSFASVVPNGSTPSAGVNGYILPSIFSPATLTTTLGVLVLETEGPVYGKRTTATDITFRVIDE